MPKLGNELNKVRSKSLKSTLALTFSLMLDLILALISFLKNTGIIAAATIMRSNTAPNAMRIFLNINDNSKLDT